MMGGLCPVVRGHVSSVQISTAEYCTEAVGSKDRKTVGYLCEVEHVLLCARVTCSYCDQSEALR